jgi:hypothetical protein
MHFSNSVKFAIFTLPLVPYSTSYWAFLDGFQNHASAWAFASVSVKKKIDNLKPIA